MNYVQQQAAMINAQKVFNEKWSIAVIHQINMGRQCFNQIAEGLPNLSPTLVSNRLKSLIRQEVIEKVKKQSGAGFLYQLTQLGQSFTPVLELLCDWGFKAKQNTLSPDEKAMDALLNQKLSHIPANKLPGTQFVLKIHVTDLPKFRDWWLVLDQGEVTLVMDEPAVEVNCYLTTTGRTLRLMLTGELSTRAAKLRQDIVVTGDLEVVSAFHLWFNAYKSAQKLTALHNSGTHPAARIVSYP